MPLKRAGRPKKVGMAETLEPVLQFGYGLPAAMGLGAHWQLSGEESSQLAGALAGALGSVKSGKVAAVAKMVAAVAPWVGLATTAYFITQPRVTMTRALRAAAREESANVRGSDAQAVRTDGARGDHAGPVEAVTGGVAQSDAGPAGAARDGAGADDFSDHNGNGHRATRATLGRHFSSDSRFRM